MGVDKARLPLRGRPMAEVVADVLRDAGCERVFLIRRGPPDGLPWQSTVIREDTTLPRHVLSGFVTALDASHGDTVLVAACDLFELDRSACRKVIGHPRAVAWGEEGPGILAHLTPEDRADLFDVVTEGGSFRRWAKQRPRVDVHGALANANRWSELGVEHPLDTLVSTLGLAGEAAERAAEGERSRLAAHGCLLP
ncbi:MAG: NTP transferase domain-containing protein [Proteobacteria bacterium]|nr:NTP transferase domain-containing protein [Pseudomonadota bacterium]